MLLVRAIILGLTLALLPLSEGHKAFAVNPDEVLEDATLEARARALSKEVRCMVCQNQSIDDSDATLAKDLRVLIRERLVKGDSDPEVLNFLVDRFGEFVLLKPRFSFTNAFAWLAPLFFLGLGGLILLIRAGRPTNYKIEDVGSGLDKNEEKALKDILDKD